MGDNLKLKDILDMKEPQLQALLKKDLVAALTRASKDEYLSSSTDMTKIIDLIDEKLTSMENAIISSLQKENKRLSDKLDAVEFVNDKLAVRVANLERNHWKFSQYERRNNVEIAGIPNEVDDNNLEQKVCEIFKSIDVDLNPNEIEACHRLPYSAKEDRSKPKWTIIKVVRNVNRHYGTERS